MEQGQMWILGQGRVTTMEIKAEVGTVHATNLSFEGSKQNSKLPLSWLIDYFR